MALYSTMTADQLQREMDKLRDQGEAAFNTENWSEYEVLMKKWYLAKSYLIENEFIPTIGQTYHLTEEKETITVTKLEGIMAWGYRGSNGIEFAVPIAMLTESPNATS